MSRTVHTTRLGRLQLALSEGLLLALKGEPLFDGEGNLIMVDGKPLLGPPKPANFKEAREYLKDMGITEEPEEAEGRVVHEIANQINQYEKDEDALLLAATKEV